MALRSPSLLQPKLLGFMESAHAIGVISVIGVIGVIFGALWNHEPGSAGISAGELLHIHVVLEKLGWEMPPQCLA